MTEPSDADSRAGRVRGGTPLPLRLAVALLTASGVVSATMFVVGLVSQDWAGFVARASSGLMAKGVPDDRIPGMVATTVVLALATRLIAFAIVELPVLFGWLAIRGHAWARVVVTVLTALLAALSLGDPSPALLLDALSVTATVLLWLPSSSALIRDRSVQRKRSKDRDANALIPPNGRGL
ncbi:hypothetical protein GCM10027406_12750 [Leifsonia lichenia]